MDWAAILKKAIAKNRYTKEKAIEATNALYLTEQISLDDYNEIMAMIAEKWPEVPETPVA